MRLTRRGFLQAATLTGLAGCGQAKKTGPFAGRELRVFCYAGGHDKTMREAFVPRFESETGASVSLYPGWWDGIPKLKAAPAGDPPFDLMISDATQGYPAAREGLFATLNVANIPNARCMVPAALDNFIYRDRLGIPYPDSVMTLAHQAKVPAPAHWADLWRADLSGKLGFYSSFYMSLYTFACVQADLEGKAGTAHERIAKDLDGVLRFARDNRSRVKFWWTTSTEMILELTRGGCTAGNMHSPEYLQALRENPDLAAVVPDLDRAMVQVFWSVPAGSPNQDLAERAIDLMFSEELQLAFARRGMATANPEVAAAMAKEDPLWGKLYPHTPEQFSALRYYPYEVYARHWDRLADEWERTVLRKA